MRSLVRAFEASDLSLRDFCLLRVAPSTLRHRMKKLVGRSLRPPTSGASWSGRRPPGCALRGPRGAEGEPGGPLGRSGEAGGPEEGVLGGQVQGVVALLVDGQEGQEGVRTQEITDGLPEDDGSHFPDQSSHQGFHPGG